MTEKQKNRKELLDSLCDGIEMPRLTGIHHELLSIAHMPLEKIEMRQVASLVESDPTLTAAILRAANSAYFGTIREINTVTQAISRMGFEDAIHILSYHCLDGLMPIPNKLPNFAPKVFWIHSWATATVARMLWKPQYLLRSQPGELYTAGLLHDIGKVVLAAFAGDSFNQACIMAHEQGIPIHQAEMQIMGLDHAMVGSRVLEDWNLPIPIMNAVRHHHALQETDPDDREIVELIELADAIAYRCGFPDGTGQPGHDFIRTSIVKKAQGPLASVRTINHIIEDASALLVDKGRIVYKADRPPQGNSKTRGVWSRRENKIPLHQNTEIVQHPGIWKKVSGRIRSLFQ